MMTLLTSAECRQIAERKMAEAAGHKELRATAEAWLILADTIEQAEALERLKAKGN
jgi:cold shock protein